MVPWPPEATTPTAPPLLPLLFGPLTTFVGDLHAGHAVVQASRPKSKRTKVVARSPYDPRWWLHPTKGWRRR